MHETEECDQLLLDDDIKEKNKQLMAFRLSQHDEDSPKIFSRFTQPIHRSCLNDNFNRQLNISCRHINKKINFQ